MFQKDDLSRLFSHLLSYFFLTQSVQSGEIILVMTSLRMIMLYKRESGNKYNNKMMIWSQQLTDPLFYVALVL